MKKIIAKRLLLIAALLSLFSCNSNVNQEENEKKPVFYLKNTKVIQPNSSNDEKPELVLETVEGGTLYSMYKIGTIEHAYIQSLVKPFRKHEAMIEMDYEYGEISTDSIVNGISNSISHTNTVSMSNESSSTTVKLNINNDSSGNFWDDYGSDLISLVSGGSGNVMSTLKLIAKKCSIGINSKRQTQEITQSVTDTVEETFQTENKVSNINVMKIKFDATKLENDKYYTIGLTGNYDIYQVFQYDLSTNNYITYFITLLNETKVVVELLYSDNIEFSIPESYKISPIEQIDINIAKYRGDGTEQNPYLIYSVDDFLNINNNLEANYKLARDIDFEGATLKKLGNTFSGTLDGNGYKLQNYKLEDGTTTSLFNLNTGIVKNIFIDSCSVSHTLNGAAVCIKNTGTIENIIIQNYKISSTLKTDDEYSNCGICCTNDGIIKNIMVNSSEFSFTVKASSTSVNCGIARTNNGTIENIIVKNNIFKNIYNSSSFVSEIMNGLIFGVVDKNNGSIKYAVMAKNTKEGNTLKFVNKGSGSTEHLVSVSDPNYITVKSNDIAFSTNDAFTQDSNGEITLKYFE